MKKYPMSVRVFLGALVLLVIPALVAAQTPDLSGTWVLNESKSTIPQMGGGRGGGGMGSGASQMVITTEGGKILITTTRQGRQGPTESTQTYTPDGKQYTMEAMGGRGGRGGGSSQVMAAWNDGKLVITTTRSFGDQTFSTSEMYSLQDDGTLLVESERPGRGGGAATVTKLVYDKK